MKQFTPQEAAAAVLAKAAEILKKHELAKSEPQKGEWKETSGEHQLGHPSGSASATVRPTKSGLHQINIQSDNGGYTHTSSHNGGLESAKHEARKELYRHASAAGLKKFEKEHEDKKDGQDNSVTLDQTPEETNEKNPEGSNPNPGSEPQDATYDASFKGHIKLAKFMGHMESKKNKKGVSSPEMNKSEDLIKAEGSEGIGKTRSGKTVYKTSGHKAHADFSSEDHHDAAAIHHMATKPIQEKKSAGLGVSGRSTAKLAGQIKPHKDAAAAHSQKAGLEFIQSKGEALESHFNTHLAPKAE